MKLQVTIEVEAESQAGARLLVSQAGFTVTRVTKARATTTATTPPNPFTRASAILDMPDGLDPMEHRAYVRGYAAGCLTFARKRGVVPLGDMREVEWARHPTAHRKGLAELARWREIDAAYRATRQPAGRLVAVA